MDNLKDWYSRLQQYTSERGQTGLPPMSALELTYMAGNSVEDAFLQLYPPAPVTIEQAPAIVEEEAPVTALAIAASVSPTGVSEEDVLKKVADKSFTVLPSGKVVLCEIVMQNGHVAHGQSILGDSETSMQSAQSKALQAAIKEVWKFEVYLARETAYRQRMAEIAAMALKLTDQSNA